MDQQSQDLSGNTEISNVETVHSDLIKNEKRKKKIILFGIVLVLILIVSVGVILVLQRMYPQLPADDQIPVSHNFSYLIGLKKSVNTKIPQTSLELTFTGRSEPEDGCNDCFSVTEVIVKNGSESHTLQYVCGGIAGICSTLETAFGYNFELIKNVDVNNIDVKITQKHDEK